MSRQFHVNRGPRGVSPSAIATSPSCVSLGEAGPTLAASPHVSLLFPCPKPRWPCSWRRGGSRPSGVPHTHLALAGCGVVLIGAGLSAQSGVLGVVIMCQLSFKPLISHWGWGAKMPAVAEESPSTPLDGLRKVTLPRGLCAAHCAVNKTCPRNPP